MPLKINVGLSKKVGLPDYGSCGASCHLEFEADSSLLFQDLEGFQENVRAAYAACQRAVDEQLAEYQPSGSPQGRNNGRNGHAAGNGSRRNGGPRPATTSQVRAIHAIAKRQQLDLATELRDRYGRDRPDDLSISEASEFIDAIKPQDDGGGGRR